VGLEAAYMKLREQAREFEQGKQSRVPSDRRDEFGGITLANSPKASGTGFFITEDGFLVSYFAVSIIQGCGETPPNTRR